MIIPQCGFWVVYYVRGPSGLDPRDPQLGISLLQKALEGGDDISRGILGEALCFESLFDRNRDGRERGMKLLEEAVSHGDVSAMSSLAEILMDRRGFARVLYPEFEPNVERGLELLERAMEAGDQEARRKLGDYFLSPFNRDLNRALEIMNVFVEEDDPSAMNTLGWALIGSENKGHKERGICILERLIETGDNEVMQLLGLNYIFGRDVEEDVERGVRLLERAGDMGDYYVTKIGSDVPTWKRCRERRGPCF